MMRKRGAPVSQFVSVKTDISSTPNIYNKAICMLFEHLWSVIFFNTQQMFDGHVLKKNYHLIKKATFYDQSLPLAMRLGVHEYPNPQPNWLYLWQANSLSLLTLDQRCRLLHVLSLGYLMNGSGANKILPQFPRVCYIRQDSPEFTKILFGTVP